MKNADIYENRDIEANLRRDRNLLAFRSPSHSVDDAEYLVFGLSAPLFKTQLSLKSNLCDSVFAGQTK
jgi:hypothetical protein